MSSRQATLIAQRPTLSTRWPVQGRWILAIASAVGLFVSLLLPDIVPEIVGFAVCLGVLTAVVLALRRGNSHAGVWQPAAGLLIGLLAHVLVVPWANEGHPLDSTLLAVVGAFLLSLGVGARLGYAAGALVGEGRPQKAEISTAFVRFSARLGIVIGALALFEGLRTGAGYSVVEANTSAGLYSYLTALFQICLVIVATESRSLDRPLGALLVIAGAGVLASGFRGGLLTIAVFVFVWIRPTHSRVRGSLRRVMPLLAGAGLALLFYGPVSQVRAQIGTTGNRIDVVSLFTNPSLPDARTLSAALSRADSGQAIQAAFSGISPTLSARDIPTYFTAPITTAFLPPQLFAKQVYDDGRPLAYEVYGIPIGTPTSSTVTWFGEAWLVAGWQGVLVIPLLLGLLVGAAVRLVCKLNAALWAPTMGILTLSALDLEHSLITLLAGALREMALLVLLAFIFHLVSHNSGNPSGVLMERT